MRKIRVPLQDILTVFLHDPPNRNIRHRCVQIVQYWQRMDDIAQSGGFYDENAHVFDLLTVQASVVPIRALSISA